VEGTSAERRAAAARRGRHAWGRGRHQAPGRPFPFAPALPKAALAVAAATVIAAATSLGFPRAVSNATERSDEATESVGSVGVEAVVSSTVGPTRICPIDWRQSQWHVKKLIRCAAEHHGVSTERALYIAWRESRYQPSAYNEDGPAAGIYQHLTKYWPERAERYGFPGWSAFDGRANIIVTMRMVSRIGWGPWEMP
jgi:hypothetical protein